MHDEAPSDELHEAFWSAIAASISTPIDAGGRRSVREQLDVAFQSGWTPPRLARWISDQVMASKRLSNPAGFVIARLREIPAPAEVPVSQRDMDAERAAVAKEQAKQRRHAAEQCDMCDDSGRIGKWQCHHDPDRIAQADRARVEAQKALSEALARKAAKPCGSAQPVRPSRPSAATRAVP